MMCLRRIIGRCTSEISGPRIGTLWATWKKSQEGANPGSSNGASTGNPSGALGLFTHTKRGLSSSSHGMVPTFSTPSFGPISPSSGTISEEELGNVSLQPVTKDVSCRDLHGPWVIVLPQNMDIPSGELMFELDGSVCYRPGEELGGGIGKYTLQVMDTTPTTITIHLECYTYAQKGSMPPSAPAILHIQGLLQHAVITSHDQKILTLHGHAECVWNGKKETGMVQAAKLDGWTPESQKVKPWVPNYTLQQELSTLLPPLSSTRSDVSLSRAEHRVGKGIIDSVYYVPKWISSQAEEEMLSLIQNTPEVAKSKLVKRVAQEWGCTMCQECNLSFVSDINLPPWCSQICDAMITDNVFSSTVFPNSVRIHEYNIGDGIAPHVDGPIYVPIVAIISLGAPCVFSFYPKREPYENPMEHYDDTFRFDGDIAKDRPLCSVVLESRSLLIFEKDAYWYYPHGISDRATDSLREDQCGPVINRHLLTSVPQDATELPRAYRVGVTVRHLLPRCAHQINRQEYFMKRAMSLMKSTPTHLNEPSLSSRPSGSNARTSVSALPTSSTNSGNKSTKGKSAGVTFPRVRGEHTATTNPLSTSQVRNSDGQHSEGRPLEPPTAPSQPSQTQDRANHFSNSTVSKIDTGKAIPSTAPFPPSNQHTETVPSTGPVQQNTLNTPGDTSTGVKASFPCEAPHVQHVMPMGWGTAAHPGAMHPPIPMYPMYYCAPGLPSPLAYAYPPHVPNMSYPGTAQVSPHTTYIPQPPYTPNGAMPHHHPSPPPTFNNPATNSSSGSSSSSSSSSNTHVALQQDVSPKSATTAPCTDVLMDMKKKLEVTQKTLDTVVRAQNELQQTMQTLMMTLASAQEQSGSALDTVSRAVVRMDVALNKITKNNISSS